MKKVEILAPAGSFEGMKAAVKAGCDAVYLGGSLFGARAFANNLTEEQLLTAIDYAHLHSKKLYLTVNTLLKEEEISGELYSYLEKPYCHGLDAVIVQDMGVLKVIHEEFPELPIHASTQMSVTGAGSASLLKRYGVTRVVTARELSLAEIQKIASETGLEIETFVHGALCYSYSGKCLMSSMIGGRSGNRGRCAQSCRLPYKMTKNSTKDCYPLSPKDIMTIPYIPELVEAGICSFKIEGRMKRLEYAAYTTSIYRKYLDKYEILGKTKYNEYVRNHVEEWEEEQRNLLDLYNRGGFSSGYLFTQNGPSMMSMERPNHEGVFVGTVTQVRQEKEGTGKNTVKKKSVSIELIEEIHAGDLLEIRKDAQKRYDFTVKDGSQAGKTIYSNVFLGSEVEKGMSVYRTKNEYLLSEIQKNFLEPIVQRTVKGRLTAHTGRNLELEVTTSDGGEMVLVTGPETGQAKNQPVTKEQMIAQITKTGTSDFVFGKIEAEIDSSVFFPMGALKAMRRKAFEELQKKICEPFRRNLIPVLTSDVRESVSTKERYENSGKSPFVIAGITEKEQWNAIQHDSEIAVVQLEMSDLSLPHLPDMIKKIRNTGKKIQLKLPYILRESGRNRLIQAAESMCLNESEDISFLVENLEEYAFLTQDCKVSPDRIIADFFLYTYNKQAKEFLRSLGVKTFTASPELNEKELNQLGISDSSVIVYGHIPLMISAQCIKKNTASCNQIPESLILTDRKSKNFIVRTHCKDCYNVLYNGEVLCLFSELQKIKKKNPYAVRLDFTNESEIQVKQIMDAFWKFWKEEETEIPSASYTKGHFKRGIE